MNYWNHARKTAILIALGAIALASGCAGGPLSLLRSAGQAGTAPQAETEGIQWIKYYEAMGIYNQTHQPFTMLYFTRDSCEPCRMFEKRTLSDPRVVKAVEDFIPVMIRGDIEVQMAERFNIQTYPMIIFARLDSGEIDRKAGYRDVDFLLRWIKDVKANRNTMAQVQSELDANPDDPELLVRQARNYLDADDLDEAMQLARKALEIAPKNADVMVLLAIYHLRLDQLDEAQTAVTQALQADPNHEEAKRLQIAILLKQAEKLLKDDDYSGAAAVYSRILELDSNSFTAYIGLGHVHLQEGDDDGAFKDFRKAVVLRPDSPIPHVAMGDLYQDREDYTSAEQEYLKAIQKEARYEPPYFRLMELYEKSGRRDQMMEIFKKVTPLEPAGAHNEIAWLMATSKHPDIFDPVAAEKHAEIAVELDPDPMYIDTLAEAYYAQGKFDLAIAIIKEAIADGPDDMDYYQGQLEKFQKAREKEAAGKDAK